MISPSPIRPSISQGFVRSAAESAYPDLWDGVEARYVPVLGATGSRLLDLSYRQDHADLLGGMEFEQGTLGSVVEGDGTGSGTYGIASASPNLGTGDFSITAHVKYDDWNSYRNVIAASGKSGPNDWILYQYSTGEMLLFGATYHCRWDVLGGAITDWFAVTVIRRSDVMEIWQDGVQLSFTEDLLTGGNYSFSNGKRLTIGSRDEAADREIDGQIAYLEIASVARTPAQIQMLHADPLAPFIRRRRTVGFVGGGGGSSTAKCIFVPF